MPPSTLNALVKDYNDGFLLNYLDPRELTRSLGPPPWALRATAPTDHNLSQKVADTGNNSSKTFSLPKYLNEKHQIAVDASGLEINQQYYNFGSIKIQRNKMILLTVFAIGLGLYIGATVLNKTPINDLSAVTAEVGATQSNKAPADMDAQQKQSLLDFMNEANKSVPKERVTPKKSDLFDLVNLNIADSTKDEPKPSFSSKQTPPAKKIVEETHTKKTDLFFDFSNINIADNTKDKAKQVLSSKQTPPAKNIVKETHTQNLKLDSVKKPVVDTEKATLKKEETSSSGDTKAKQKRNILHAVKNMIRSAICALRNKCD